MACHNNIFPINRCRNCTHHISCYRGCRLKPVNHPRWENKIKYTIARVYLFDQLNILSHLFSSLIHSFTLYTATWSSHLPSLNNSKIDMKIENNYPHLDEILVQEMLIPHHMKSIGIACLCTKTSTVSHTSTTISSLYRYWLRTSGAI